MNFRDRLKRRAIKTRDLSTWNQFRKTTNQVNREIKSAKKAYYKTVFNSCVKDQRKTWGNCGNGLSEKLQKLQNRAARILMCANYDSNIDELFRALGWRKLKYQRLESATVMMYKSLHGMTPEYLSSRFVFRNDVTSYRLRNTENKLALLQPRTN